MHWLFEISPARLYRSVRTKVLPNLGHLSGSELRRCRCCDRLSLFLCFSQSEEFKICVRCRANLRYEMIATVLRRDQNLGSADVLELDRASPLRSLLATARTYTRTYYDSASPSGTPDASGAQRQDVTGLSFADGSFDIIVSSEVLEHVPDLERAFSEMVRVLRPGGRHIFTVPPAAETKRLADIVAGQVVQLVDPPEYHGDPLGDGTGILAFWHLGTDFPDTISTAGLRLSIVLGPLGNDRRIVWCAEKPLSPSSAQDGGRSALDRGRV